MFVPNDVQFAIQCKGPDRELGQSMISIVELAELPSLSSLLQDTVILYEDYERELKFLPHSYPVKTVQTHFRCDSDCININFNLVTLEHY